MGLSSTVPQRVSFAATPDGPRNSCGPRSAMALDSPRTDALPLVCRRRLPLGPLATEQLCGAHSAPPMRQELFGQRGVDQREPSPAVNELREANQWVGRWLAGEQGEKVLVGSFDLVEIPCLVNHRLELTARDILAEKDVGLIVDAGLLEYALRFLHPVEMGADP